VRALTWARGHPLVVDVVIAGAVTLATLVVVDGYEPARWPRPGWYALTLATLTALPTVLRRRAPVTVLIACCGFAIWYTAAGYFAGNVAFGAELAWYTVAASRPPRVAAPCGVLLVAMFAYTNIVTWGISAWEVLIVSVMLTAILWRFGDASRQLAERNAQLVLVSAQLRREQEDRERRAITEERVRIARELHDVVAHHISVISVQAGLAEYVLESEPGTARQALSTVMDVTAESLEELRRVLALLRLGEEDPPDEQPLGLDRLPELAGRIRAAGVPLEVEINGTERPLPPGVDLCAFRVIQESLTNVLKHAPGAPARLSLSYEPGQVSLRVSNGASATRRKNGGGAGGHGLVGMRERAALYGGTLTAGPRPDGGFAVALTVPTTAGRTGSSAGGVMPD